jgi:hypothetical protein
MVGGTTLPAGQFDIVCLSAIGFDGPGVSLAYQMWDRVKANRTKLVIFTLSMTAQFSMSCVVVHLFAGQGHRASQGGGCMSVHP